MSEQEVTKEEFEAYVKVQYGGKTNMFDVNKVIQLSKYTLDKPTIIAIMKQYHSLSEKYPEVVKRK